MELLKDKGRRVERHMMKNGIRRGVCVMCCAAHEVISFAEYQMLRLKWAFAGARKPDAQAVALMKENVTVIYKSFERQKLAKRLYRSIQTYYPGVRVIIADDSRKPLDLQADHLEVIQLPFNSGLSYGLNRALERVKTPYVIRMDDDQLLTPYTRFDEQLRYLLEHPQVDLVGVLQYSSPKLASLERVAREFYDQPMAFAPRKLIIPHMTQMDGRVIVGKGSNAFVISTQKLRQIGYDDQIRMMDHQEFFYRAAGRLVSAIDPKAFVFHNHNRFKIRYQQYRMDIERDRRYIAHKIRCDQLQAMKQHTTAMNIEKNKERSL